MMSESALSRYAGPIVLTVGAYLALIHLALLFVFMKHSDPAVLLADPIFRFLIWPTPPHSPVWRSPRAPHTTNRPVRRARSVLWPSAPQ
jgi:hypothetical protein